jgi:hypothetical protein
MPLSVSSAAATAAAIDDNTKNPAVAPGTSGRHVVHITLHFDGVTYTPDDIYDMVDAQYGTVTSPKSPEGQAHGNFIFTIST